MATVYCDGFFRAAHGSAGSVVTAAQVWGYEKAVSAKNELGFLINLDSTGMGPVHSTTTSPPIFDAI